MGFLETSRQLADLIGSKAADLVAELIRQQHEEARTSVESFANSKVNERYAELHRRVHEDIAGVELRLTAQIADSERRLGSEIGAIRREATASKQELSDRLSATERTALRWMMTLLVVQSLFLVALGWASKHLL